jgi:hypothetical protein
MQRPGPDGVTGKPGPSASLRQRLEEDPDTPVFFQTESGVGYRFIK